MPATSQFHDLNEKNMYLSDLALKHNRDDL